MTYFAYVLFSEPYKKIYIGQTNDLMIRLAKHNAGLVRSTKAYRPWKLVYFEECSTRSEALCREKELKSHQGRDYIRNLLSESQLNGGVRQLPD
jgi:putative endonuclease